MRIENYCGESCMKKLETFLQTLVGCQAARTMEDAE